MLKNKLLESTFWFIITAITLFLSFNLAHFVEAKDHNTEIIQLNYLNGGDKINNGLYTK